MDASVFFLNLGCLRRGAAVNIRVNYRITLSGEVLFLGGSHVRVDRDPDLDIEYIELRVFKDKNFAERWRVVGVCETMPRRVYVLSAFAD